jgi:hypothetical protein
MLGSSPTWTMQPGPWNEAVSRPRGRGISCSGENTRSPGGGQRGDDRVPAVAPDRPPVSGEIERLGAVDHLAGPRRQPHLTAGLSPGNGIVADDGARRIPERTQDRVPGGRAGIKERASRVIPAVPTTPESTPSAWFTSARHRIIRSETPVWASGRWPRCETLLQHRHAGDPVVGGQIVRGGEPVPATAHDHHVIAALHRLRTPGRWPRVVRQAMRNSPAAGYLAG